MYIVQHALIIQSSLLTSMLPMHALCPLLWATLLLECSSVTLLNQSHHSILSSRVLSSETLEKQGAPVLC